MFSVANRKIAFEKVNETPLDLIIIGGGITGAGIALDAAKRGMKVALFEKNDFASGTSSKSTKLIHGGLRYLKQFEFSLVKEVGIERAIVYKNARHIVIAEKMLLPILKNGSLNNFFTNLALWVYDFLAGVEKAEMRKMLNKEHALKEEPLLYSKNKSIKGAGIYYEYRTDDARLTIEVLKKAQELGAFCFNYAEVKQFIYENDKIIGVEINDTILHKTTKINALNIINATGPWVDLLRKVDKSLEGKRLLLSKGVHIVIDYKKLPIKQAIYFDTADKRMIFAIPRNNKTYIGTTDTIYNADIDNPKASKEDITYLLESVNAMFPSIHLNEKHIESSWVGLRPLIFEDGKSATEISRKDEIFISKTGLISIAGGKLTGYRKMAQKVVDLVRLNLKQHNAIYGECKTQYLKVSGGNFNNNDEITDLIIQLATEARRIHINIDIIKEWVYRYGSNAPQLLTIAKQQIAYVEDDIEKAILLAELIYTIQEEMVFSLSDFYIRRTSKLFFDRKNCLKHFDFICLELASRLKLTKDQITIQRQEFMQAYNDAVMFE